MKKQALSLFLAGALALSLFGCSAQPAAESAPQSSPAKTAAHAPPPRGGRGQPAGPPPQTTPLPPLWRAAHLERCAITPL